MMIYGIIFISCTIIGLGITVILLVLNNKTLKNLNTILTTEIVETKQAPIIIGTITRYKEEELKLLLSNPDVLDLLIRIYEYNIAKKTDSIRTLVEVEKKVGYIDGLHEMHLFFIKMKQSLKKKEDKVGQGLI